MENLKTQVYTGKICEYLHIPVLQLYIFGLIFLEISMKPVKTDAAAFEAMLW